MTALSTKPPTNKKKSEDAKRRLRRTDGSVRRRRSYTVIDLFSGAGGLSHGFVHYGGCVFSPVWANDFNDNAVITYNANFGTHCRPGDLVEILQNPLDVLPAADVVIGGPPCQGFSLLNKKKGGDPRKRLWRPFLQVVRMSGASVFLMENVPQLLGSEEHIEIDRAARKQGFHTASAILNAADYGVPQRRYRAFILGCKGLDPTHAFPPKRTHVQPENGRRESVFKIEIDYVENPGEWTTVHDAIGDLPAPIGTEIRTVGPPLDLQFGRNPTPLSVKRYRAIPEEGMNRFDLQRIAPDLTPACWIRKTSGGTDLFGRLWWDRPAFTIRTEFFKPEKGRYLHPSEHRPITHREAARLQTFPDSFRFHGNKTEIAKQIGNAVPPLLAKVLAGCVHSLLDNKSSPWSEDSHRKG